MHPWQTAGLDKYKRLFWGKKICCGATLDYKIQQNYELNVVCVEANNTPFNRLNEQQTAS